MPRRPSKPRRIAAGATRRAGHAPKRRAPSPAAARRERLVGAWILAAVAGERADGSRFAPFGPAPKGIIVFAADGHFALFQSTGAVPRIAGNDRAKATAAEALAIVGAAIAYYGTWALDAAGTTLSVALDGSTFANLLGGPAQTRHVTKLDARELRFTNPKTPQGVTLKTVWTRAKTR